MTISIINAYINRRLNTKNAERIEKNRGHIPLNEHFLRAVNDRLFGCIYGLRLIMYIICKEYILRRKDEDIIDRLNMTCERLDEIKSELREDFRKGYLGI